MREGVKIKLKERQPVPGEFEMNRKKDKERIGSIYKILTEEADQFKNQMGGRLRKK